MDIVDSFVVSLGIDPTNYKKEIKNYRDDRKRLSEEDAKFNRTQEDGQKRLVAGVKNMRNEVAGFLFVLAGANGVKDFAASILNTDAATGRFAANIGVATEKVSAWEEAVKRAGGTASEGRGMIGAMMGAYQTAQLEGQPPNAADWAGLGMMSGPTSDPIETMLRLSEARARLPQAEFAARLQRLGFSEAGITLLSKGRHELELTLRQMERQGVATKESAAQAIAFDNALQDIEQTLKGKARPAVDQLAGALVGLTHDQEAMNTATNVGVGLLGAVAITAGIAYAPFFALAGVIYLLAENFDKSDNAMKHWSNTWRAIKMIADGDVKGGSALLWQETKSQTQEIVDDAMELGGAPDRNGRKARIAARNAGGGGSAEPSGFLARGAALGAGNLRIRTTNNVLTTGRGGTDPEIYRVLAAKYGATRAAGITAGIKAEGGSLGMAANGAFGIGQWRGPRQRALFRKYGPNPTKAQQLEFLMSELDGGDHGGASVLASRTSEEALSNYIGGDSWGFMRPGAAGRVGDMRRGRAALRGLPGGAGGGGGPSSVTTTIGEIKIYTGATDAAGIAKDLRTTLAQRGVVMQANSGLRP